jgi:hypothetical protein
LTSTVVRTERWSTRWQSCSVQGALHSAPRPGAVDRLLRARRQRQYRDTWEPLESLTNCEEAIATFQRATGRTLARSAPRSPLAAHPAFPPPHSNVDSGLDTAPRRTLALRSSANSCSTDGRTTSGSAAPSPTSVRVLRSRTWGPTRCCSHRAAVPSRCGGCPGQRVWPMLWCPFTA